MIDGVCLMDSVWKAPGRCEWEECLNCCRCVSLRMRWCHWDSKKKHFCQLVFVCLSCALQPASSPPSNRLIHSLSVLKHRLRTFWNIQKNFRNLKRDRIIWGEMYIKGYERIWIYKKGSKQERERHQMANERITPPDSDSSCCCNKTRLKGEIARNFSCRLLCHKFSVFY